ncbi:MAG: GspE/PulE family protein, partial [Planctomycetes bacterium]|nr:GspE/PulE family protein [Planctomycetota bacterium]
RRAIAARASDVHFDPGDTQMRVRFRVDGLLQDIEELPTTIAPNVVARLKVLAGLLTYRSDIPQEGGIAHDPQGFPCDIRVATFPTVRGERVVLRIMAHARRFLTLDDLGHDPRLLERLTRQLTRPQGLLLVCGPAGSGKTTTLYACLEYILRQRPDVSILSVEDPVEIRLDGVTQIEIEPARGLTYPIALRSLLRQDPQVLMIGEVRDAEVAEIIVEAALTGHLVLTTMHSGSPAEAIVRLREMGLPPYQITSTLQGVLAQRLLRTLAADALPAAAPDTPESLPAHVRYASRTAVGHFVEMSPALRQAILDGADVARLAAPELCPGSLREDAQRLLDAGLTTLEEVRRVLWR